MFMACDPSKWSSTTTPLVPALLMQAPQTVTTFAALMLPEVGKCFLEVDAEIQFDQRLALQCLCLNL